MDLLTPFYQDSTLRDPNCPPVMNANYDPYLLFSFKNWIYYWIRQSLSPDVSISYKEVSKGSKTYLALRLSTLDKGDLILEEDLYQTLLDTIKSFAIDKLSWVPVFYFNQEICTNKSKLPMMWINDVMRYINVDRGYQGYLSEVGFAVNLQGNPEYLWLHSEITLEVKNKLIEFYELGALVNPSMSIISDWKMGKLNEEGLYRAMWFDNRVLYKYTYLTDFLISRVEGETSLTLRYPIDIEMRYLLGILIRDYEYTFTQEGIDVTIFTYDQLIDILTKIDQALITPIEGITLDFMYLESLSTVDQLNGGIIYKTDDQERPYTYVKEITSND